MFDFENLIVYQKAKEYNSEIIELLLKVNTDKHITDQLKRASFSIMLNIAEGTSRFSKADKKNFYVISRGSAFECVAILDFMHSQNIINPKQKEYFYDKLTEISKMLFSLISITAK